MDKKDFKVIAFLAYKNIIKSKSTFFVIIAVMAMSFLSITFFAAIIDGLGYEFEEGMIEGLTGHLMIEPTEDNLYLENVDTLVKNIKRIPGVIGVAPRLESSVIATYKNTEMGIPVFFIDSTQYWDMGLFAIGKSCFGPVWVNGLNLVPWPPCRIIPFILEFENHSLIN